MNEDERIKPCEAARDGFPHKPHWYKQAPTDPRDAWECPGYEKEDK